MAVIHISREEAAGDFDALLARAGRGDEILIESEKRVVARILPGEEPRPRLLSETIRILAGRGSTVTLDGDFERDLKAVVDSHPEALSNPWD